MYRVRQGQRVVPKPLCTAPHRHHPRWSVSTHRLVRTPPVLREVEVVCRDGSLTYRQEIIRRVQNIASTHRGCLPAALPPVEETAEDTAADTWAGRHARRLFEAVHALTRTGRSHRSVARNSAWTAARCASAPEPAPGPHEELQTKGYSGHCQRVRMAVAPLRRGLPLDTPHERPPAPTPRRPGRRPRGPHLGETDPCARPPRRPHPRRLRHATALRGPGRRPLRTRLRAAGTPADHYQQPGTRRPVSPLPQPRRRVSPGPAHQHQPLINTSHQAIMNGPSCRPNKRPRNPTDKTK